MRYILVHGLPESGKDLLCYHASKIVDGKVFRFADKVKHSLASLLSKDSVGNRYTPEYYLLLFEDRTCKELFRTLFKWYATDFVRTFFRSPDHWIYQLEDSIKDVDTEFIFIPDLRFENEYQHFKNKGDSIFVKIKRDSCKKSDHISDEEFPDEWFDLVLENNGTVKEFLCSIEQQLLPLMILR